MAPALIVQDETYGPMADTLGQGAKLVVPSGGVTMDADGVFTLVGASSGLGEPVTVAIEDGAAALPETSRYLLLAGEGDAADDLATITGGDVGAIVYLQAADGLAAPITLKHDVDNIMCDGGFDVVLTDSADIAVAVRDANAWTVLAVRTTARRNVPATMLQFVTVTVAEQVGSSVDVACQIVTADGVNVEEARAIWVEAIGQTPGEAALGPPTVPDGSNGLAVSNPATGPCTAALEANATGGFSFTVSDAQTESVVLRITADGCKPLVRVIDFEAA